MFWNLKWVYDDWWVYNLNNLIVFLYISYNYEKHVSDVQTLKYYERQN